MKLAWIFVLGAMLGGGLVSSILGASAASACHYTSKDKAAGYKC